MSFRGLLFASCCFVFALAGPAAGKPKQSLAPSRVDALGDALPPRAIARIGTTRFHQHINRLAFSPDGRIMALGSYKFIRLCVAATGKDIARIRPADVNDYFHTLDFSPDGRLLAVGSRRSWAIYEAATGQPILRVGQPGNVLSLAFSADSKLLATGSIDKTVRIWNVNTGQELQQLTGDTDFVYALSFVNHDRNLAVVNVGEPEKPGLDYKIEARVWDLASGKISASWSQPGGYTMAFSADGSWLAAANRWGNACIWDTLTGKLVREIVRPQAPGQYLTYLQNVSSRGYGGTIFSMSFSPDGKRLVTNQNRPAEVLFWETATGKIIRTFPAAGTSTVTATPEGVAVATGSGDVQIWDAAGKDTTERVIGKRVDTQVTALAGDGTALAVAGKDHVRIFDLATSKAVKHIACKQAARLVFAPDGKVLAAVQANMSSVQLLDIASGKEMRSFSQPDGFVSLTFVPDGTSLTAGSQGGEVSRWDLATGKKTVLVKQQPRPTNDDAIMFGPYVGYSPDWKLVGKARATKANTNQKQLDIIDVRTGAVSRSLPVVSNIVWATFSPDSRFIAVGGDYGGIHIWDLATGRTVCEETPNVNFNSQLSAAFSLDSKLVAIPAGLEEVSVRELASGQEVCRVSGHQESPHNLEFSDSGRILASASSDGTCLVWEITGRDAKPVRARQRLKNRDLPGLWNDLAGKDAARAYQAIWTLVNSPKSALTLLKSELEPVERIPAERIRQRIANLGSSQYAVRVKATADLEVIGEQAVPELRKAATAHPGLEVRCRIDRLLERAAGWNPDRLRASRAVMVVEQMGTPPARKLLKKLAAGVPEARLTREAQAALERLAK